MKVAQLTFITVFVSTVLIWAHDTFLLLFTGALLAIVLHSTAAGISRFIRLPQPVSLAVVVLGSVCLIFFLGVWSGPVFLLQLTDLAASLPHAIDELLRRYHTTPWNTWVAQHVNAFDMTEVWKVASGAGSWILGSAVSGLAAVSIILFTGVCFASEPKIYVNGFLLLFP